MIENEGFFEGKNVGVACEVDGSKGLYLVGVRSTKRLYLINRNNGRIIWEIPSPTNDA